MANETDTRPLPTKNCPNEVEFARLMRYVAAKLKKARASDDAKGVRDCCIIYTMFLSGASAEDLALVRVGDVDLARGYMKIYGEEGNARRRQINIEAILVPQTPTLKAHFVYWLAWKRDHGESTKGDAPLFCSEPPGLASGSLGTSLSASAYYTVWAKIRNRAHLRHDLSFRCARIWYVRQAVLHYNNAQYVANMAAMPLEEVMELAKLHPAKEASARKPVKKKGTALSKKAPPEKAKPATTPPTPSIADVLRAHADRLDGMQKQVSNLGKQLAKKQTAYSTKVYPREPPTEPDKATSVDVSDFAAMLKETEKQAVLMRMQSQMLSDDHERQRCNDESSGMLKVLAALRYRYREQFENVAKTEEP
jgi:hypothetical protein